MEQQSSFLKRTLSKQDAIIQIFRPQLGNKVSQVLDMFDRLVDEAETLITNGTVIGVAGEKFRVTPDDLKSNLDEYKELEQIATEGRAFLNSVSYVTRRKNVPFVGAAPVGKNIDVTPIEMQLPGSEPLHGAMISPK